MTMSEGAECTEQSTVVVWPLLETCPKTFQWRERGLGKKTEGKVNKGGRREKVREEGGRRSRGGRAGRNGREDEGEDECWRGRVGTDSSSWHHMEALPSWGFELLGFLHHTLLLCFQAGLLGQDDYPHRQRFRASYLRKNNFNASPKHLWKPQLCCNEALSCQCKFKKKLAEFFRMPELMGLRKNACPNTFWKLLCKTQGKLKLALCSIAYECSYLILENGSTKQKQNYTVSN